MTTLPSRLADAAVALGLIAGVNHMVAGASERRHPPAGRFLRIQGIRLHVVERGAGPPVVLLHGNGAMAEDWFVSGVAGRLATGHRVVAFDRPGFGYTGRPRRRTWTAARQAGLIAAAMDALALPPAIVVGHSWGTLVALELALSRPTLVSRLVLLSGFYTPEPRGDVALMSPTALPVLGDAIAHTLSPPLGWLTLGPIYRKLFGPAAVTARFARDFPIGLSLRPRQIQASAADTALMIPAATALGARPVGLAMPVAIAAGTGDRVVDFATHSARLHRLIPGSVLHRIEGAGHMIHHSAPDEVTRIIEGT